MVGAPGFEPGIGRLKVCCDTISPYSALVGRLTKSLVTLAVRPRFAEQSQGNEAVTRLDDHLSLRLHLVLLVELVERVIGFEPILSAWKAVVLAVKHHTRIHKILYYKKELLYNIICS
jgi:hypothetical protein